MHIVRLLDPQRRHASDLLHPSCRWRLLRIGMQGTVDDSLCLLKHLLRVHQLPSLIIHVHRDLFHLSSQPARQITQRRRTPACTTLRGFDACGNASVPLALSRVPQIPGSFAVAWALPSASQDSVSIVIVMRPINGIRIPLTALDPRATNESLLLGRSLARRRDGHLGIVNRGRLGVVTFVGVTSV